MPPASSRTFGLKKKPTIDSDEKMIHFKKNVKKGNEENFDYDCNYNCKQAFSWSTKPKTMGKTKEKVQK